MKPDLNSAADLRKFMKEHRETPTSIAKEIGTSPAVIAGYAEYSEDNNNKSFWQDNLIQKLTKYMDKVWLATEEDRKVEEGVELQKASERKAKELRKKTLYKRAKVVHAIIDSVLMSDEEKEENILPFMD